MGEERRVGSVRIEVEYAGPFTNTAYYASAGAAFGAFLGALIGALLGGATGAWVGGGLGGLIGGAVGGYLGAKADEELRRAQKIKN